MVAVLNKQGLLADRVALVTGAGRGLGFAIAHTLAREGAKLVINDLDGSALDTAASELETAGYSVRTVIGNVASVSDGISMVSSALEGYGRLDILVNNAGGSAHTPTRLEDVTEEEYNRVMDWNVRGTFFCTQAALPALKIQGGAIVNMSSMSGRAGLEIFSPQYSAAKAAIVGLTRNLASHLGVHGIRVNAIAPGFISSGERADTIWKSRDNKQVLEQIALHRRGSNAELADVALFLASDQSRYMTGCIVDVNGGYITA